MEVIKHKEFIESFNNAIYHLTARLGTKSYIRFSASNFARAGIERELGKEATRHAGNVFQIEVSQEL